MIRIPQRSRSPNFPNPTRLPYNFSPSPPLPFGSAHRLSRACIAPEAVCGVREGALPPDADAQGREGAAEAVPHDAKRGEGWQVHAHHHAAAREPCQALPGVMLFHVRISKMFVTVMACSWVYAFHGSWVLVVWC